jgi:hypothetical protein
LVEKQTKRESGGMKYNVNINQKALVELAPELDIVDAAIIDYLIVICNSKSAEIAKMRLKYRGHDWTWVDLTHLLADMPLLKINYLPPLTRRLQKIEKSGFIKRYRLNNKKLFIRTTALTDKLLLESNGTITVEQQNRYRKVTYHNTNDHVTKPSRGEVEKKILKFLQAQPSIRNAEAYLDHLVKEYGTAKLHLLLSLEFSRWKEHLDYWKQK